MFFAAGMMAQETELPPRELESAAPLRTVDGAWTEHQVQEWVDQILDWLNRSEVLISLLNVDTWRSKDGTPLTEGISWRVQHTSEKIMLARFYSEGLNSIPFNLWVNVELTLALEEVIEGLQMPFQVRTEIRGAPSVELSLELFNHGVRGDNLLIDRSQHYSALIQWYSNLSYPKW